MTASSTKRHALRLCKASTTSYLTREKTWKSGHGLPLYSGKEEDEKKDEDIFSSLREELEELDDLREGSSGSYKARARRIPQTAVVEIVGQKKQKNIEVRSVDGYQGERKW